MLYEEEDTCRLRRQASHGYLVLTGAACTLNPKRHTHYLNPKPHTHNSQNGKLVT